MTRTNTSIKLTPHFTLSELTKSATALRLGFDNRLNPLTPGHTEIIGSLSALCFNILEPVREHFGVPFSPSSGYRCVDLNDHFKSKRTSQHIKGEAVDFEVPGIDNLTLANWIAENLDFDQCILEFYEPGEPNSGWVHCSYVDPENNRNKCLTISRVETLLGFPERKTDGNSN